jgi:wyosine [tRNA(Phe)-imidazoG37] synthetase (radical SAM superfamily)
VNNSDRFSDLRVVRYHERIQAILGGEKAGPIRANLDLTNLCNHKCFFCEPETYRAETVRDRRHTMITEKAKEVIEDLSLMGCRTLMFSGGGEPMLHPDFGHILRHAKRYRFKVAVVSNGTYISKWQGELLRADDIRISLDAGSVEDHLAMHGGKAVDFEQICQGLDGLVKRRNELRTGGLSDLPEIGVAYIISERNCKPGQTGNFIALMAKLHVDFIQFRPLSDPAQPEGSKEVWAAFDQLREINFEATLLPTKVFPVPKRGSDVFLQRDFSRCYAALTRCIVGATGDVQACCDRRDIVFGNVYDKPLHDIWLGEEHRKIAAAIVPQFCSLCLQCGYNRSVEKNVVGDEALTWLV